jgi:hypothetical protein
MVTMWPLLRSIISGKNAFVSQYSAKTLTPKTASIRSSGISKSRRPLTIPALLTTMCTGPTLALTSPATR